MHITMLIDLARLQHEELIDGAHRDRLARQTAKARAVPRLPATGGRRPIRPRILAWLRGQEAGARD